MTMKKVSLEIKEGQDHEKRMTVEFDVLHPTQGTDVIDVRALGEKGYFAFDPGFTSTASCESKITFIDGDEGI